MQSKLYTNFLTSKISQDIKLPPGEGAGIHKNVFEYYKL
jgi:hypothetical protein